MSNITANKFNNIREGQFGKAPAYQAIEFFIGGAVCVGSDGYLRKAADTAGFVTAGIASGGTGPAGSMDNSLGASGDIDIAFRKGCDVWLNATGFTPAITDFNTKVYWSDDQTVAKAGTTTNDILAGRIVDFDGTKVLVRLATPGEMDDLAGIAELTDNSGGAAADGTIGVVTAPTALTDNGGGTADGTVASQAAPVTLTDSTGLSGSHNDTLEAVTTFTPSVAWNGSSVYPSAADATAIGAAITALNQNASDTAQKVIELVTLAATAQNNLKELTARQAENRTAIVALTDAVKELATKVNEIVNA